MEQIEGLHHQKSDRVRKERLKVQNGWLKALNVRHIIQSERRKAQNERLNIRSEKPRVRNVRLTAQSEFTTVPRVPHKSS